MTDRLHRLRAEHWYLRQQAQDICEAARTLPELDPEAAAQVLQGIVDFLRKEVVPHAWLDERVLYPEVAERLGDPLVTASMNYDHQAIRRWTDDIAATDARNLGRAQQLLYGLAALITVHTWKKRTSSFWPHSSPRPGRL
jgi:hypothetical protein